MSHSDHFTGTTHQHFLTELFECDNRLLSDKPFIDSILRVIINSVGMTLMGDVHLFKFHPTGGITGMAVLAESHISIHTWPENNYMSFDLYSCKAFNPEKVIEILKSAFRGKGKYRIIDRKFI